MLETLLEQLQRQAGALSTLQDKVGEAWQDVCVGSTTLLVVACQACHSRHSQRLQPASCRHGTQLLERLHAQRHTAAYWDKRAGPKVVVFGVLQRAPQSWGLVVIVAARVPVVDHIGAPWQLLLCRTG